MNLCLVWFANFFSINTCSHHLCIIEKKLKKRRFAAIQAFEAILCNKNKNKTIQLDFRQVGSYLVECDNLHLHYFRSSKVTIQLLMISM